MQALEQGAAKSLRRGLGADHSRGQLVVVPRQDHALCARDGDPAGWLYGLGCFVYDHQVEVARPQDFASRAGEGRAHDLGRVYDLVRCSCGQLSRVAVERVELAAETAPLFAFEAGASPDKFPAGTQSTHKSMLHHACEHGHLSVARVLLYHKANVDEPNGLGQSPLFVARYHGHDSVAQLVEQYGGSEESGRRKSLAAATDNLTLEEQALMASKKY